jgi:hypothetical protein
MGHEHEREKYGLNNLRSRMALICRGYLQVGELLLLEYGSIAAIVIKFRQYLHSVYASRITLPDLEDASEAPFPNELQDLKMSQN